MSTPDDASHSGQPTELHELGAQKFRVVRRCFAIAVVATLSACAATPPTTAGAGVSTASNGMALGPIVDPSFAPLADASGRAQINGFSFVHSASWLVYPALPLRSTLNQTIGYVSTQPLENRCARTTASGGMVSESCGSVLDTLRGPDGVLLRWVSLSMPNQQLSSVAGESVTLAGRDARLSQTPADAYCATEGGSTSVTVTIRRGTTQMYDDLLQASACLVSAADVTAVRAIVDSLQFDEPSPTAAQSLASAAAAPSSETATVGNLTFTHDPRWLLQASTVPELSSSQTYAYLSTEPVDEQCPRNGSNQSCGPAVSHLKAHGVFAGWSRSEYPGLRFGALGGEAVTVDGRPARWSTNTFADCGASGASVSTHGEVLLFSQDYGDAVAYLNACLQSPDELLAVKAMFLSARFAGVPVASEFESPTSTPPAASIATATWAKSRLTFRHPRSWPATEMLVFHTGAIDFGFVSNRKLHDPCHAGTCGQPVDALDPGAVFVRWRINMVFQASVEGLVGEDVIVNGGPARWSATVVDDCDGLGGPATVVRGRAQSAPGKSLLELSGCVQSPADVAAVKAMFESAQLAG